MATIDFDFEANLRELNLVNGDFSITKNASIQNGLNILYSSGAFIRNPILGIGLVNIYNLRGSEVVYQLGRWKDQTKKDGANTANFDLTPSGEPLGSEVEIKTQIAYV